MIAGSLANLTYSGSSIVCLHRLSRHANAAVATRHGLQDGPHDHRELRTRQLRKPSLLHRARFREYTGQYPARISVVGYAFKKARFEESARQSVRWNTQGFLHKG